MDKHAKTEDGFEVMSYHIANIGMHSIYIYLFEHIKLVLFVHALYIDKVNFGVETISKNLKGQFMTLRHRAERAGTLS